MSSINTLRDRISSKTWNLVLLTAATGGIYPLMWLYRNNKVINEVTETQIVSDIYLIWIAVCVGLNGALVRTEDDSLIILAGLLGIASATLYVVWAFKAKKALEEYCLNQYKIDIRMNGLYTFLFTIYYINYCINDLEEVERKHKILNSKTE